MSILDNIFAWVKLGTVILNDIYNILRGNFGGITYLLEELSSGFGEVLLSINRSLILDIEAPCIVQFIVYKARNDIECFPFLFFIINQGFLVGKINY